MSKTLIADSGATKTDWCIVENEDILQRFQTKGISPIFQSEEEIAQEVSKEVYPNTIDIEIEKIRFYGSGCIPDKIEGMKRAIQKSFKHSDIEVYSDLVAAAHALCGTNNGIACILGTGSNSCEWDGANIVKQISPLGFILGDEGSGANLGKILVGDILKNQVGENLKEKFLSQFNLTQAEIIERVYRQPFPSRFLASVSPFVLQNIDNNKIREIAERSFTSFFERNVMQYNYIDNSVNFVGSIAWYYSDIIKSIASAKRIKVGIIEKSPMPGLIKYYS